MTLFRILLLGAALPLAACAQLQLSVYDGTTETPIGSSLNVGTAAVGASVQVRIRIRDIGSSGIDIETLQLTAGHSAFPTRRFCHSRSPAPTSAISG